MVNNTHIFDPTPPEPITNACIFCQHVIDPKDLDTPGILCIDCHRPTCPDCQLVIQETGLRGCFYCRTVELDERNPAIQKALEELKQKKLKERVPIPPLPQMVTSSGEIIVTTTDNTENTTTSSFTTVANTENYDQYPYRDPPNLLDKQEGWGVGPAIWDDNSIKGIVQEAEKVIGTSIDGAQPGGFVSIKLDADMRVANKDTKKNMLRLGAHGSVIIAKAAKSIQAGEYVTMEQLEPMDHMLPKTAQIAAEKEDAYRGSGRTSMHVKAIFNHFQSNKFPQGKRVLYIAEDRSWLRAAGNTFEHELKKKAVDKEGFNYLRKHVDFVTVRDILDGNRMIGRRYTLVITDISYTTVVMKGVEIEKRVAPYMAQPHETITEMRKF